MNAPRPTRVGALHYLNALPLVDGLDTEPEIDEVCFEIPSLLAEDLRAGALDLALVPVVEAHHDDHYRVVPDVAIGCDGAVESILLFTGKEWDEIETVGLDVSSRTSVELLKVLFHRSRGRIPECVRIPPRLDALRSGAKPALDAVLLIGDRALAEDHGEFERHDLGARWKSETGLPFVFAVWLGRAEVDPALIRAVRRTGRRGLENRRELARSFCREYPDVATPETAERYLAEVIRYELGPPQLEALRAFRALRREAGLLGADVDGEPRFFEGVD